MAESGYFCSVLIRSLDQIIENLRNVGMLEWHAKNREDLAECQAIIDSEGEPQRSEYKLLFDAFESKSDPEIVIKTRELLEQPYWNCFEAKRLGLDAVSNGAVDLLDKIKNPGSHLASLSISRLLRPTLEEMVIKGLVVVRDLDNSSIREHIQKRLELSDKIKLKHDDLVAAIPLGSVTATQRPEDGDRSLTIDRSPVFKPDGWTKSELVGQAKYETGGAFSPTKFDRIRKQAKVEPGVPGGKGQQRRYLPKDVKAMIRVVLESKVPKYKKSDAIIRCWQELLDA